MSTRTFKAFLLLALISAVILSVFLLKIFEEVNFPSSATSYLKDRTDFLVRLIEPLQNKSQYQVVWGVSDVEFLPFTRCESKETGPLLNFGLRSAPPVVLKNFAAWVRQKIDKDSWKRSIVFVQPGILTDRFHKTSAVQDSHKNILSSVADQQVFSVASFIGKLDNLVNQRIWLNTNSGEAVHYFFNKIGVFKRSEFWFNRYIEEDLHSEHAIIWDQSRGGALRFEPEKVRQRHQQFKQEMPFRVEAFFWETWTDQFNLELNSLSVEAYLNYLEEIQKQSSQTILVLPPLHPSLIQHRRSSAWAHFESLKERFCDLNQVDCLDLTKAPGFTESDFMDFIHYSESGWQKLCQIIF